MNESKPPIACAYFSMEFMLESDIPTYAGGLGVLAGDLMRSCADMGEPVVGVSLVYNDNTYRQIISHDGKVNYESLVWHKNDQLTKLPNRVEIKIEGETVNVGVWRYDIVGINGFIVPVYLLDTDFWIMVQMLGLLQSLCMKGVSALLKKFYLELVGLKCYEVLVTKTSRHFI